MLPCHRKQENLPRASCFGLVSKTAAFGVCGAQHFDARLDLVASVALVHPLCLACDTVTPCSFCVQPVTSPLQELGSIGIRSASGRD